MYHDVILTRARDRRVPVQTTERLFRESVPLLRDMIFVGFSASEQIKSSQDKILVRCVCLCVCVCVIVYMCVCVCVCGLCRCCV